jgi:hypothetical protein
MKALSIAFKYLTTTLANLGLQQTEVTHGEQL